MKALRERAEKAEQRAESLRSDLLQLTEEIEYSMAEPCIRTFAAELRAKLGPFCNDEGADLSPLSARPDRPCIKSPGHADEHRDAQGFCWGTR